MHSAVGVGVVVVAGGSDVCRPDVLAHVVHGDVCLDRQSKARQKQHKNKTGHRKSKVGGERD